MNIDDTLADLAIQSPGASKVFHRLGLDFCCKGWRSLADACEGKHLDPASVLAEVQAETHEPGNPARWAEAPLEDLIEHIIRRYHEPLPRDLQHLLVMARKVERVHGDKPTCPAGLGEHLEAMNDAVLEHLQKEERILFPMIRAGHPAHMPVQVMVHEHDDHGEALRRTRELTGDLVPPPEACTTWRALYLGLRVLERELMEHIHLENYVLFPRALAEPALR